MTSTDIQPTNGAAAARVADDISQGTAIEQARAVAEAQAAVMVAQRCPRSTAEAIRQMRESCDQKGLAERAFFRYSRGSGQITGPSVQLARELARCWGNMRYGITELRRDDVKGESEMHAYAEDLQTNTRATTTFIVKHVRDTRDGRKLLTDQRDIYETNANNGARRLREQIFAILPKWFTEEAQDRCRATLERDDTDKPFPSRVADLVKGFESFGVTVDQLERKIGRKRDDWTPPDLAALTVIGKSIRVGEARVEDEFPDDKVTAAEVTQQPAEPAKAASNGRGRGKAAQQEQPSTDPDLDEADRQALAEYEAEQARVAGGMFGGE